MTEAKDVVEVLREVAKILSDRAEYLEHLRDEVRRGYAAGFVLRLAEEEAEKLAPALADLTEALLP